MSHVPSEASDLVAFWRAAGRAAWFGVDAGFGEALRERFGTLHRQAVAGDLDQWGDTTDGSLALILLLDQLSRNLHRGTPEAFAGDAAALRVATAAVDRGFDRMIEQALRPFVYLPFEHAEDAAAHERSVALTAAFAEETGDDEPLRWARHHRDIVARFGRFPHRNAALGRAGSPAEIAFLAGGGFSG